MEYLPLYSPVQAKRHDVRPGVTGWAQINGRDELEIADKAKKLLSFTDNRQDASLQAGHFNDFVQVGVMRGALYRALGPR